jgi:hypothetical protein
MWAMRSPVFAALLLAVPSLAIAGPPLSKPRALEYIAPAQGAHAKAQLIGSANTLETLLRQTGSTVPACFGWGSLAVFEADGGNCGCLWSMTSTFAVGALNTESAYDLTDANGPDGAGAGFFLRNSGGPVSQVVQHAVVYSAPGARSGLCSVSEVDPTRSIVYRPCRVDGDCPSGTCRTAPTAGDPERLGCAMLRCQCSASATIHWRAER